MRHERGTSTGLSGLALLGTGAILAASAVANFYVAHRAERRHPPTGRFVEVDGVRLHYIERGTGRDVLLLHGNVVNATDFLHSRILDSAAKSHRVIAFDRPGMGYSSRPRGRSWTPEEQAESIHRTFASLGIERPIVVGHSFGAMVALALGLNYPDSVSGLVLLSGYYYPTARADVALAKPSAAPVLGDILRYTSSPLVGAAMMPSLIRTMFEPQPVPDNFAAGFSPAMALRPWQIRSAAIDGAVMSKAAAAMQPRYTELKMPIIVIAGAKDKVVEVGRHSARLHKEVKHSSLRIIPGVGHMVHYAASAEILASITSASTGPTLLLTAPPGGPEPVPKSA